MMPRSHPALIAAAIVAGSAMNFPAPKIAKRTKSRRGYFAAVQPTGTVGRNDPCPCGSKVKFKKCCLSKVAAGQLPKK